MVMHLDVINGTLENSCFAQLIPTDGVLLLASRHKVL